MTGIGKRIMAEVHLMPCLPQAFDLIEYLLADATDIRKTVIYEEKNFHTAKVRKKMENEE